MTEGPAALVIFGSGGMARELCEFLQDLAAAQTVPPLLGFLDDDPARHGATVHGFPVLGGIDWLADRPGAGVVLGIGSPAAKRRVALRLRQTTATFPPIVHPNSVVGRTVALGEGAIVCAGCVLTADVRVAEFATINFGTSVGHDTTVGAYATLAPGARLSGNVACGEGVELGTGAVCVQGITIGAWSIVGAGAVVTHDVPPNVTVVGVPARVVKERPSGWHR